MEKALLLDDSTFKGRQLKVLPKRQNVHVARAPFRGGRGRGGYRGGRFAGRGGYRGGRGPGRGFRGGRNSFRGSYAPSANPY